MCDVDEAISFTDVLKQSYCFFKVLESLLLNGQ